MGLVFAGPTGLWSWNLVGAFSSHLPRLPQFPPLLPPPPQASPSQGEAEALAHLSSEDVSGGVISKRHKRNWYITTAALMSLQLVEQEFSAGLRCVWVEEAFRAFI